MPAPLTNERLKEVLDYDPETGIFRWRVSRNGIKEGKIAGSNHPSGYVTIMIDRHLYRSNRLVWLYIYGKWPNKLIDHINRDKKDNRICNLREADHSENSMNKNIASNNSSGYKGVSWSRKMNKWTAGIKINYKSIYLGAFDDPLEAHKAYQSAAITYHGSFASY